MQAQDVLKSVSQDIRSQLAATGTDSVILLDYLDRVVKELGRLTSWQFLLSAPQQFNTYVGASDYWLGPANAVPVGMRDSGLAIFTTDAAVGPLQFSSVLDRTNDRPLYRVVAVPLGSMSEANGKPRLYRNDSSTPKVISLYNPPDGVYLIEFRYYKQCLPITALSDTLEVPDKYRDVLVAGVNEKACVFLKMLEDAAYWREEYRAGKMGMIRDKHAFGRGEDFIHPDNARPSGSYITTPPDQQIF